ncbi:hypothetical protein H7992_21770 [Sporosarcina sp. resist]|uniref:beta family protein n=1 Tax=Sporosarcina sp. resist TaxID=2762563 RepID=UPI00164DF786|nr:hypothetical protein [Sporosarcina sp. resist]QNK87763.1 hypothetical protein H7992_21770 [Sporosarcina sp. resist]
MYYPLLRNGNNEMKALKELKVGSRPMVIPIIESKRIKKENIKNWEGTFSTLGRYLKERVQNIKFIYDFNCALEDTGNDEILFSANGSNLVEHCISKMQEQELDIVPCFQHDSPTWLIKSVLESGFNHIAIRIRCHDFQESFDPFVYEKIKKDIEAATHDTRFTVVLDFYNHITSTKRIQNAINVFSEIPKSEIVYLATSCPEDASQADVHGVTLIGPREELNKYLDLKSFNPELNFGDYTTRLKGEVLSGFNFNNSYLKIFYSSETDYYIAKSKLIKDGGEATFHQICQELTEQDFYPGEDFSFGDKEIRKCADKEIAISGHQAPIAIAVNHHIETTVNQLLR